MVSYVISNFKSLMTRGMDSRYYFFLRPRRFGNSLAVSVMEYDYGQQLKSDDFETLFWQILHRATSHPWRQCLYGAQV